MIFRLSEGTVWNKTILSHCHVLAQIRSAVLRKRYFLLFFFVLSCSWVCVYSTREECTWMLELQERTQCVCGLGRDEETGGGGVGLLSLKKFVARPPCNDLSQSLERLQHLKAAIRHVQCSCCKYKHKDDSSIANNHTVAL